MTVLQIRGRHFFDAHGRQVLLRGVNLGGDCKVPFPDGGTQHPTDFADHRSVSFVGRPFPLAEADEHLARLAQWGFNCLRLLTTWEAVEHAGPGRYDEAYLDYFAEVCRRAGSHGLSVFVDFHQDAWSRMSGGDGAPGWVFEAVGLDFTRFHASGAAHVMQRAYDYGSERRHQPAYPSMSWVSNYRRPANGIMWTLFWGGRRFTPDFSVDGRNVQDFLQDHLLGAMEAIAHRLAGLPNVMGFDTLNEPGLGWLGQPLSPAPVGIGDVLPMPALPGLLWSPLQALAVARGLPTALPRVGSDAEGSLVVQCRETVNPGGVSIWLDGRCPFEQAGVYQVQDGAPLPVNEAAFQRWGDRAIDISEDAFGPYFHRVAQTVRRHLPRALLFAELDPLGALAGRRFPQQMPERWVNASHWYDLTLLLTRRFDVDAHPDLLGAGVARGTNEIHQRYVAQLARAMRFGQPEFDGVPTLIGEFGIPYDLHEAKAYAQWANGIRARTMWRAHEQALSLMYDAMDQLQLSCTQWNYTASNRNDARIGDGWNQEDLSIFSIDQTDREAGPDSGGRAVAGFCRPYPRAVQGELVSFEFDTASVSLRLVYQADPQIGEPTELYLPTLHFPEEIRIEVDGPLEPVRSERVGQYLRLWARTGGCVRLTVAAPTLTASDDD